MQNKNTYVNLQNTATPANVTTEAVVFKSNGYQLKGTLYKPTQIEGTKPAIVVTGAWTTVKEQMAGTYARELAARGFIALAFDFTGWGESEGDSRYVEDPTTKTADIQAAVAYLKDRSDVDPTKLIGLGICASSGYMAQAVADNPAFSKLALVAPWLHDRDLAETVYGGADSVANLIAASESKEPTVLTAASITDQTAPMFGAPYYTESHRGLIPTYDNKFNALTWKPWLTYNGQASASKLKKPILMVGSEGMALPAGAKSYEMKTKAPLEKVWFDKDVNQFDFYDRADIVKAASDAIASFIQGS